VSTTNRWWRDPSPRVELVDIYQVDVVRLWLVCKPSQDFDPMECGRAHIGIRPDFLINELSEGAGWHYLLDIDGDPFRWLLENGLVPNQPFMVELRYLGFQCSCGMTWCECSPDVEVDIVRRAARATWRIIRELDSEIRWRKGAA
jgi:hypothetical protein